MNQTVAAKAHAIPIPNTSSETRTGVSNVKFLMWLFLAQDAMTFFGLFGAYTLVRFSNPKWPIPGDILDIPLTAINTFILICSSVTMVKALASIKDRNRRGLRKFLALTMLGGLTFLSIQAYEWTRLLGLHNFEWTNLFGIHAAESPALIAHGHFYFGGPLFDTTFFALTGFHGFHVTCGVIYLGTILVKSRKYSPENYTHVEAAGLYWHFVDLIWILLFTLVYLIS